MLFCPSCLCSIISSLEAFKRKVTWIGRYALCLREAPRNKNQMESDFLWVFANLLKTVYRKAMRLLLWKWIYNSSLYLDGSSPLQSQKVQFFNYQREVVKSAGSLIEGRVTKMRSNSNSEGGTNLAHGLYQAALQGTFLLFLEQILKPEGLISTGRLEIFFRPIHLGRLRAESLEMLGMKRSEVDGFRLSQCHQVLGLLSTKPKWKPSNTIVSNYYSPKDCKNNYDVFLNLCMISKKELDKIPKG